MFAEQPPLDGVDEGSVAGLRSLVASDLAALRHRVGRVGPHAFPYATATALYRVSRFVRARGHVRVARMTCFIAQALTGAEIDPLAVIGPGFQLAHTSGVVIGPGVRAGRNLLV